MTDPADLVAFRLALSGVVGDCLAGAVPPPEIALFVWEQARLITDELAERRHRPGTAQLAARIAQLERQMRHMEPGERATAIRRRLGLSKTTFYRLRKIASPGPEWNHEPL